MNESAARSKPSKTGAIRTGADYLASIKNDGRHVVFDGDVVRDVTTHPAFGGAARSIGRLFDVAGDPKNAELMTLTSPKTGAPLHYTFPLRREGVGWKVTGVENDWRSTGS
jgi:4-hydroxyphenylacetate 3-monooxygenase